MSTEVDAITLSGVLALVTHKTCSGIHSYFHRGHLIGIKKATELTG